LEPEIGSAERERLILALIDSDSGIFGCEVCQLCGRLGMFSGYAGAMGTHLWGEFVPFGHGSHDREEARKKLEASDRRFCEVCRTRVSRSNAYRAGSYWLCALCVSDPKNRDENADFPLKYLSKRRYIERKSDEEIRAWAKVAGLD
jgi:hypothetical protein